MLTPESRLDVCFQFMGVPRWFLNWPDKHRLDVLDQLKTRPTVPRMVDYLRGEYGIARTQAQQLYEAHELLVRNFQTLI